MPRSRLLPLAVSIILAGALAVPLTVLSTELTAEAGAPRSDTATRSVSLIRDTRAGADQTPPRITITSPADGAVAGPAIRLSGNASDNSRLHAVEIAVGNGPFVRVTGDKRRWTATANASAHSGQRVVLTARAVDGAGNTAATSVVVHVPLPDADPEPSPNPSPDKGDTESPPPEPQPGAPPDDLVIDIPDPPAGPEPESGCSGVHVTPDSDVQGALASHPPDTTFCFAGGVYRLEEALSPRAGQRLLARSGAVLRGSKSLSDWVQDGDHWYVEDQTQRLHRRGKCSGNDLCDHGENVFADGVWLEQVVSRAELGAGRYFFDYETNRIYLADDPTSRLIEATVARNAVKSTQAGIAVRGFTIEHFGNPAQEGAIEVRGDGWLVQGNLVRHNQGVGIRTQGEHLKDVTIRRNVSTRNGQLGIGGHGIDMLIEENLISENNIAGFSSSWEAGASKWVRTIRLTVRGNTVLNNAGHGLWTDIDNIDTLYERNHAEGNGRSGIFHEISYAAVIRDNLVRGNGFDRVSWASGAGIRVANSSNVIVSGNVVEANGLGITLSQQDRGTGRYGPWELQNVLVERNLVVMPSGYSGLLQDVSEHSYFTEKNNRFAANRYRLSAADASHFAWENRFRAASVWRDHGNDVNGMFTTLP